MTTADRAVAAEQAVPGTTRISTRALEHLAVGLVGDAAQVAHREVSVRLADAGGALKVSVTLPVAVGARAGAGAGGAESIGDRADRLRGRLIEGMRDLSGRSVDVVDLRYSGVRRTAGRRAR